MKRNNSGPRIDPWGTPLVAFLAGSFLVHLNILFLSDQQIMPMTLPQSSFPSISCKYAASSPTLTPDKSTSSTVDT